MNWWGIAGVICLVGLLYAVYLYRIEDRKEDKKEAFWSGFLMGSLGCAGMIFQLFLGFVSLYVLYLIFSWEWDGGWYFPVWRKPVGFWV